MMVGGEGSGKSLVGAMELLSRCFEGNLFWLVGADYDNTKPEFDYIVEAANKLGILEFASTVVNPGKIVLKGGITISTISAKDPRNISKFSPHGILVCEAAQCDFQVIQRLIARLGRAGEGGWMLMTGCLVGDTLVATSEGLLNLRELVGTQTHNVQVTVPSLVGNTQTSLAFYNGKSETVKLNIERGLSIEGTPNHRVICINSEGSVDWVELKDAKPGTLLAVRYGTINISSITYSQ